MPLHGSEEGAAKRFILHQVLSNVRCGACGARYRDEDIAIVETEGSVWMLMAVCPRCDTQAMIMVVVQSGAPAEEPLLPLAEDDVLDFHVLMRRFEGDLRGMVGY